MLDAIEAQLAEFDRRLSRFRPGSELSRFNCDEREEVPASALLRDAVRAGIWAAHRTGGLVDPTLLAPLEAAGYATSRSGSRAAPLADALAAAPPRRPARPDPREAWRSIRVLDDVGTISRPPGVRFDPGGIGKGLAADLVAQRLEGYGRYAIDCGGDVRVGGRDPGTEPVEIEVRDPITGTAADAFTILRGAVATSGIDTRLWLGPDGRHGHHLIDPATGEPAWTGADRRDRARGDGARGRHACQGRAAERPRGRSPLPLRAWWADCLRRRERGADRTAARSTPDPRLAPGPRSGRPPGITLSAAPGEVPSRLARSSG